MLRKGLFWINLILGAMSLSLIVISGVFFFMQPKEIVVSDVANVKRPLPKNAFEMKKECCEAIGKNCFELQFTPLSQQLPDLRNHLIYFGRNGRPDAKADKTTLHFAFQGNTQVTSIMPKEKLYLIYDRTKLPNQYLFSPNNKPTTLWMEAALSGNDAVVDVRMVSREGEAISNPPQHAQFRLSEKEGQTRTPGKTWEMGKWRVDGSLLVRQKASWKGIDRFLERHGGEEYIAFQGKHRIEFYDEEKQETYGVYIGLTDSLIWNGTRWKLVEPGENSLNYPLMVVKKIDERIMNFELWDVGGKAKMMLNLVKSHEPWIGQAIDKSFECLGARTRSQYIFEIDKQRVIVSPKDWLLKTEEGWVKLKTPQEIDEYVDRKKVGLLFVFDDLSQKEDQQVLTGVVFNSSRTEMQEIEIPIQKNSSSGHFKTVKKAVVEDDDDDDDDDDFDDDP